MSDHAQSDHAHPVDRRSFLQSAAALGAAAVLHGTVSWADEPDAKPSADRTGPADGQPTKFQIACMTLPYSQFPLERALKGIREAGYDYVAWGTSHRESASGSERTPVMPTDAPPSRAKELGAKCRDIGLEPVMMFSTVYPEAAGALEVLTRRIEQAAAAGVGQVLTFGHTKGGNRKVWVERFKKLGPIAADHDVTVVVKQHGGSTGTGQACAEIIREVDHPNVWVNFDAGNVMDYLNLDPIPDINACAETVRSFCIKDHRNFPTDQDCGPGYGEIDHYRLLAPVARTGLEMPLACENIFAPVVPRPEQPEGVDRLARRAREFLEVVIAGLHATGGGRN